LGEGKNGGGGKWLLLHYPGKEGEETAMGKRSEGNEGIAKKRGRSCLDNNRNE